jgi:hypothetical protein
VQRLAVDRPGHPQPDLRLQGRRHRAAGPVPHHRQRRRRPGASTSNSPPSPGQTIDDSLIVNRRETTTQLIIKDRQTVVISGLLRQEDSDIVRKVPLLGDIPVLGLLFKSKERTKTNSELLIFITPIVVNNTGENDALNVPYRERLEKLKSDSPADGRSDEAAATGGRRPLPRGEDAVTRVAGMTQLSRPVGVLACASFLVLAVGARRWLRRREDPGRRHPGEAGQCCGPRPIPLEPDPSRERRSPRPRFPKASHRSPRAWSHRRHRYHRRGAASRVCPL